jgi:hypothetical protein
MSAVLAAGGEIWMGDETLLREFPPLRARHGRARVNNGAWW